MSTYSIRVTEVNGEPMLDAAGMSLMFGVHVADVEALIFFDGAARIPDAWLQQGRRRTREAAARVGSNDFDAILGYWARKDHDAELEVVYR